MKKELKERLEGLGFSKSKTHTGEAWKKETFGGTVWVWESEGVKGVEVYVGDGKVVGFRYDDAVKDIENIVRIFEMVI